jgi:hypothetical protein
MKCKLEEIEILLNNSIEISQKINFDKLDESEKIAFQLWVKFIQNNKSIVKLMELDYFDEAQVVHRLSMEHLFNIFALVRSKEFIKQFKNNSENSIPKALKEIDKHNEERLTVKNQKILKEAIKKYDDSPIEQLGYSIYNAAQLSELGDFYNTVYRIASIKYAHSTFLSAIQNNTTDDTNRFLDKISSFLKISEAFSKKEFIK